MDNTPYDLAPIKALLSGPQEEIVKKFLNGAIEEIRDLLSDAQFIRMFGESDNTSISRALILVAECKEQQAIQIAKRFDMFFNDYNEHRKTIDELFEHYGVNRNIIKLYT